ncbi:MAG: hypothetical protein IJ303_02875 [Clostridia bacterium]|nr:hypothetical protein [Clostridia bacterium]
MRNEILTIKEKLRANSLTSVWLINRLAEHEVFTDKTEMSAILTGIRRGPKVDEVVSTSLDILELYERTFVRAIN